MRRSLVVLVASFSSLGVACGGSTTEPPGQATPTAQTTTGSNAGPEVFTPAQVQAARVLCNEPDGPAQTYATFGAVRAAITGSWLICSVSGDDPPSGGVSWATDSIELDANGQWVSLGLDAEGGLVHVYGVDNQGSWAIEDDSDSDGDAGADVALVGGAQLTLSFDSGGWNGGSVAFNESPTLMQWEPDYWIATYVPLGP